jgi:RND family efflux transporter MFP subunit
MGGMADLSSDLASLKIDRDVRPDRGPAFRAVVYLVLLGGIAGAAYFVGWPYLASRIYKTNVEVTEVVMQSPAQDSMMFTSTGYVVAQVSSKVSAKIAGRIAEMKVKENDVLKQGDVIARLEDVDQKTAIAAANTKVAAAQARAQQARAQLAEIKLQADRERALAEKGVSSKSTVEDLDARATSLAGAVRAADADVVAAQAEVKSLQVTADYTTIVAPIAGTVIKKNVQPGELVGPVTGPLVEIADMTSQEVETDVPEARVGALKEKTPAEIVLDMYPDKRFAGEVSEISKHVDRSKATVLVKVRFSGDMSSVIPDMAARVSFTSKPIDTTQKEHLVIPKSAIATRDGAQVVFVIIDGKTKQTAIDLGEDMGDMKELKTNLSPGTKVVNHPGPKLRDGQAVKQKE